MSLSGDGAAFGKRLDIYQHQEMMEGVSELKSEKVQDVQGMEESEKIIEEKEIQDVRGG
jgi:tRNA 2-selenouridine synthase SelU